MRRREKLTARMAAGATAMVMVACFAESASANGFAAVGDSVIDDSTTVTFNDGFGEANNVNFNRLAPGTVRVFDGLSNIDPVAPCVAVTPNAVDCPIERDSPWVVVVNLGEQSDSSGFSTPPSGLLEAGEGSLDFSFFNGGSGEDIIEGTPGRDVLDGGDDGDVLQGAGGADTFRGGSGNDRLIAND
ncbi:MAG: hypothetical protein ACSLFD_03615, partial [Solirubrobacterales bacterium]